MRWLRKSILLLWLLLYWLWSHTMRSLLRRCLPLLLHLLLCILPHVSGVRLRLNIKALCRWR